MFLKLIGSNLLLHNYAKVYMQKYSKCVKVSGVGALEVSHRSMLMSKIHKFEPAQAEIYATPQIRNPKFTSVSGA